MSEDSDFKSTVSLPVKRKRGEVTPFSITETSKQPRESSKTSIKTVEIDNMDETPATHPNTNSHL